MIVPCHATPSGLGCLCIYTQGYASAFGVSSTLGYHITGFQPVFYTKNFLSQKNLLYQKTFFIKKLSDY
jgi:hypothetical protein